MEYNPLIGPVIALVAWTLVMLVWMAVKRAPFVKERAKLAPGLRGADMPAGPHNWPAHNYMHLLEQPTIFYAIVLALVAMDDRIALNLYLAWAYVILRVIHSIWQATVNTIQVRFPLFALATLCLLGLTLHAAFRFWH